MESVNSLNDTRVMAKCAAPSINECIRLMIRHYVPREVLARDVSGAVVNRYEGTAIVTLQWGNKRLGAILKRETKRGMIRGLFVDEYASEAVYLPIRVVDQSV